MSGGVRDLAIVIPAYKGRFLDQTLASIAAQTCRDFVVYVGDDASPDGIGALCERWRGAIDLRYTRFDHNLGASDLVAQWQRCVALSSEPWVWLFGDDDLMPADGVQRLLAAVHEQGLSVDLLRFNVERIDAEGRTIGHDPEFPPLLRVREFARGRLEFSLASYAPEYVFARGAFERRGGFVPFPRAWCTDDATWIRLAAERGIRTLGGAKVRWRRSSHNISGTHANDAALKTRAELDFLLWLDRFLTDHPAAAGEPSDAEVLRPATHWFFQQAKIMNLRFAPGSVGPTLAAFWHLRGASALRALWLMLRQDLRVLSRQRKERRAARG